MQRSGRVFYGCADSFCSSPIVLFLHVIGEPLWSCTTKAHFLRISCLLSLLVRVNIIYQLFLSFMWLSGFTEYSSMSTHNSFLHAKCIQNISILVLLFLSPIFIFFLSILFFCEPFKMLYCSQGPKLTNGQAQMESGHAELCRKLSIIGTPVDYNVLHIHHPLDFCIFTILVTFIIITATYN